MNNNNNMIKGPTYNAQGGIVAQEEDSLPIDMPLLVNQQQIPITRNYIPPQTNIPQRNQQINYQMSPQVSCAPVACPSLAKSQAPSSPGYYGYSQTTTTTTNRNRSVVISDGIPARYDINIFIYFY